MPNEITQEGRVLELYTPCGKDFFLIDKLDVDEGISRLFTIRALVLVDGEKERAVDETTFVTPERILGQPVSILLNQHQNEGVFRYFNGIVNRISQGKRDRRFSYYTLSIVPHAWLLTQRIQNRIFTDKTVPDILSKVFEGLTVTTKVGSIYHSRPYTVQYRESDWDFASRLMEEEGIFYYFVHEDGMDKLVIGDSAAHHEDCPNKKDFVYYLEQKGEDPDPTPISGFYMDHQLRTGKTTLRDHNFQLPTQKFNIEQPGRENAGGSQHLEHYDFPGGFSKKFDGIDKSGGEDSGSLQKIFDERTRLAQLGMEALDSLFKVCSGESACSPFTSGHKFSLSNHPNDEFNGDYVLTSVSHSASQSPDYYGDKMVVDPYTNTFECISHGGGSPVFRPLQVTPKPIVYGTQTATVVGSGGDEIFTDKYGRIKVQFHWDRYGQSDPSSSAWIRVGQAWAGNKWGMMFIPRVGMEVIVHFLYGDPDQPIATGCVYNASNMPPYTLPDEKTKSTMKSNSSLGGGGFNEIRFEDKKGSEQIFIHGEKDLDVRIRNDAKEIIKNDHHNIVENNEYRKVKADQHLSVTGDKKEKVTGGVSQQVTGDIQKKTSGKYAMDATSEIHLKAGMKIILESSVQISLKVGGNFVDISPAGINIVGMPAVNINSGGSAGSGSGSSPESPTDPQEPVDAEAGEDAAPPSDEPAPEPDTYSPGASAFANAAAGGTPFCASGGGGGGGGGAGGGGGGNVW